MQDTMLKDVLCAAKYRAVWAAVDWMIDSFFTSTFFGFLPTSVKDCLVY